jgi:hypothetical protein
MTCNVVKADNPDTFSELSWLLLTDSAVSDGGKSDEFSEFSCSLSVIPSHINADNPDRFKELSLLLLTCSHSNVDGKSDEFKEVN